MEIKLMYFPHTSSYFIRAWKTEIFQLFLAPFGCKVHVSVPPIQVTHGVTPGIGEQGGEQFAKTCHIKAQGQNYICLPYRRKGTQRAGK